MSWTAWTRLNRSNVGVTVAALLLTLPLQADDDKKAEPPPVEVQTQNLSWATVTQVVLPGKALHVTPWPATDNNPTTGQASNGDGLAVLLRDETAPKGPRLLYQLRGEQTDLAPVFAGLPEKTRRLHTRGSELWLGEKGKIHRYTSTGKLETVLEADGLNLGTLASRGLITEDLLIFPEVGRLRQYSGARPVLTRDISLPVQARRKSRRLELWSPAVRRLPGDELLFATDPQSTDKYRVRTLLIDPNQAAPDPSAPDPSAPDPTAPAPAADDSDSTNDAETEGPWQESWSRFDDPEDINQFRYTRIDGHPALIVATTRGDKLGIFEKLKVRVFMLRPDRTRAGRRPVASFETVTRNWYTIETRIVDLNGDGKDDLLLIQPDGLGAGKLKIELYPGRGGGRFETRSKVTKFEAEAATWDITSDFTGDGVPDLLVVADEQLRIHPSLPKHKKQVVAKEPLHTLGLGELDRGSVEISINVSSDGSSGETRGLATRPRLLNLDRDETPEIVLVGTNEGRAVIRIVDLK